MKLVDKDKITAEIARRIKYDEMVMDHDTQITELLSRELNTLYELSSFIKSLEVKEVDVEKESELIANSIMISVQANLYHTNVYDYEKRCYKHSDLKDAARKGIELSLKTQKGE